jgi:hypothetical protein
MFDDWQSHMNSAEYRLSENLPKGARDDCTKALAVAENDEQRAESYYQRGFAYIGLIREENNTENAIADWKKAADYGHDDAVRILKEIVNITYTPQRPSSSSGSSSSGVKPLTASTYSNFGLTRNFPPSSSELPPNFTGNGKKTLSNGNVLEGSWLDGRMHGKGKIIYPNGCVYEGNFVDGQAVGIGKYTYKDGRVENEAYRYDKFSNPPKRGFYEK